MVLTAWFVSGLLFALVFTPYTSMTDVVSSDAYSGAILFIVFLSEMRRPMDFWKAVFLAQGFITVIYVFFGAFVRHTFIYECPRTKAYTFIGL